MTGKRILLSTVLRSGSSLRSCVRHGLGALRRRDVKLIDVGQRGRVGDSLDLDSAMQTVMPNDPRWDYLLSVPMRSTIVGVEPHSARSDQVGLIIRKKEQSQRFLRSHFRDDARVAHWYWVASGSVGFTRMERIRRRLDQNGIEFVGRAITSLG